MRSCCIALETMSSHLWWSRIMWEKILYTCMCNWVTMLYGGKLTEQCKPVIMKKKNSFSIFITSCWTQCHTAEICFIVCFFRDILSFFKLGMVPVLFHFGYFFFFFGFWGKTLSFGVLGGYFFLGGFFCFFCLFFFFFFFFFLAWGLLLVGMLADSFLSVWGLLSSS